MFKRRNPRSYGRIAGEFLWPRGGWTRAARYVVYRVRRLPDPPERVGRGVAAGIFISFTPFFGAHLVLAAATAWMIGGNILAALLATFIGNPLTTPFIAVLSVSLGRWMLGIEGQIGPQRIVAEIARATGEFGSNVLALVSERKMEWAHLEMFLHDIFLPYLVGGILPGLAFAIIGHYLTLPVIAAYHRRRADQAAKRLARRGLPRAPKDAPEVRPPAPGLTPRGK